MVFTAGLHAWAVGQALHVSVPDAAICAGGSTMLTAQISGGTPPYTYVWSPATSLSCETCSAPVASPPATTVYNLVVTDNSGGIATDDAVVIVAPPIAPTISSSSQSVCVGGTVTLVLNANGGTGSCNIVWESSPTGNDDWTPLSGAFGSAHDVQAIIAGVTYYRARYTCSGSGCGSAVSNVATVFVIDDPAPTVSVYPVSSATCVGQPVTLTADVFGAGGNCTIQWQRASPWTNIAGATGPTYTPPATTNGTSFYRAVVSCPDNNCGNTFISNQVPVAVLGNPAVSITPSSRTLCVGGTARFTASPNGANLLSCDLIWFSSPDPAGPWTPVPGATGATFIAPATTEGVMYYTAAPECFNGTCPQPASNVVTVTIVDHVTPNITLIPLSPLCDGEPGIVQATITGTGDNYSINNLEGTLGAAGATNGVPVNLMPLPPGTHCFTVSGNNGCTATEVCTTLESAPPPIQVSTIITPESCNSLNDGQILTSVSGGVPPYAYLWSSGSITSNISNLPAGVYGLTLTDANGCFLVSNFTVGLALSAQAGPDQVLNCLIDEVVLQGSATPSGSNISYIWFAPDSSIIGTQPTIAVNQGGWYRFRATNSDISNCFSEDQIFVTDFRSIIPNEMRATLTACNTWLLSAVLPPNYFGPIDFEWTLPDGSMSNATQITANQTGVYQLRSTIPGSGCESFISQFINAESDECAAVGGRVVYDTNENCNPETNEAGLAGWIIRATSIAGTFYSITDDEGRYHFTLPLGNYTLSALPPSASWSLCAGSYFVNLTNAGQSSMLNIPAQYVVLCPELEVLLSAPLLRRCFPSTYTVQVCNTGTEPVAAPQVRLELDDFLSYQNSQYVPDSLQGQTIFWTLPALAPGQCRQFWVRVLVSCEALLGQVHCSTVMATPDLLCTPASPAWSGASLEVSGECTGNQARFRVRNAGTGDLDAPVPCIVIEDVVMLMHQPNTINQLSIGEEVVFDFPANGSTYFFSVGQAPHHPFGNPVTVALEGCGTNDAGTFSTGFVNQLPLQNATPASHTLCLPNIGAYDPNDKQAIPVGYGPEHFIRAGDPLHYKIRFQNTGTDTAFTVIIRDTLSPWLDMATLRPGPSSHDYKVHIDGARTLVFTFDNILLPDSTTNLDGSQGFVDFFIHTLDSIPLDTRIENSAAIYFDFNEPVITNTVFHTIGTDFIRSATAVFQPDAQSANWKLMPNPAQEEAWLVLEKADSGLKTVWLYDAFGRQVLRQPFDGERCRLPLAGMTPGWYALRLTDATGRSLGAGRLVVR